MSNQGRSVPVYVGDDQGGYIEFVGQSFEDLYTNHNVFYLDLDGSPNTMTDRNVKPHGKKYSNNYLHTESYDVEDEYFFASPIENDPWMAIRALAFNPLTVAVALPISHADVTASQSAILSAQIIGGLDFPDDDQDHHVELSIASGVVADQRFNGIEVVEMQGTVALAELGNSLNVELGLPVDTVHGIDVVYLNSLRISYPRNYFAIDNQLSFVSSDKNFKVTGFDSGQIIVYTQSGQAVSKLVGTKIKLDSDGYSVAFNGAGTETQYFITTANSIAIPDLDIVSTHDLSGLTADHLVIAHPDFIGQPLEDYLGARSQFATGVTEVVSTADIYFNYRDGIVDAQAIKEFVDQVALNSNLESVMLVGGDVYDYKNNLGLGAISFVPTLYRRTGPIVAFSPVDQLYGDVDGVPEIAVGRLPVRTVEELQILLDKMELYALNQNPKTSLLAADAVDASSAYDFTQASNAAASILQTDSWSVNKIYVDDLGYTAARQSLIGGLDLGPRLAIYSGHSAASVWSFNGLFNYSDTLTLNNSGRPMTVLQWGCYNTYFVTPQFDSMAYGLMLAGDQGAAVVIGSSTLTDASAEQDFSVFLQNQLIVPGLSVGSAMANAKAEYVQQHGDQQLDILWGVPILGDPMLSIQ